MDISTSVANNIASLTTRWNRVSSSVLYSQPRGMYSPCDPLDPTRDIEFISRRTSSAHRPMTSNADVSSASGVFKKDSVFIASMTGVHQSLGTTASLATYMSSATAMYARSAAALMSASSCGRSVSVIERAE